MNSLLYLSFAVSVFPLPHSLSLLPSSSPSSHTLTITVCPPSYPCLTLSTQLTVHSLFDIYLLSLSFSYYAILSVSLPVTFSHSLSFDITGCQSFFHFLSPTFSCYKAFSLFPLFSPCSYYRLPL